MALSPLQLYHKAKTNRLSDEERAWLAARLETYPYFPLLHLIAARDAVDLPEKRRLAVLYSPDKKRFWDWIYDRSGGEIPPPPDHFTPLTVDSGENAPVSRSNAPHYARPVVAESNIAPIEEPKLENAAQDDGSVSVVASEERRTVKTTTDSSDVPPPSEPIFVLSSESVPTTDASVQTTAADAPLSQTACEPLNFSVSGDAFDWRLNAMLDFRVKMFAETSREIREEMRRYAPGLGSETPSVES
ncbi:MAG: hypothetical protein RMM53_13065, partial [Bacteroidia bacterium]|nr:hypothetical protein [Bacteroidia bacterium]